MYGALHVQGNRILDKDNNPVQLKGMSLFWSQWSTAFYNAKTIQYLAKTIQCTVVRAAIGDYLINDRHEQITTVIDAAIANNIYVIIDWHAHDAVDHKNEVREFFISMATKYKNVANVIFEIYNEPENQSWSEIKTYAETIIHGIRQTGANHLIIVGTSTWCQDVDIAVLDRINDFTNIAYTLHFYAGSHRDELRLKAQTALNHGIAIFVTEWGTCDASGNGNLDLQKSEKWIQFMNSNYLSWCNWSVNDKDETTSALKSGISSSKPYGPWHSDDLTESDRFVFQKISDEN